MKKKRFYLEFTEEQADLMVNVFNLCIHQRQTLINRIPSIDFREDVTKFLYDCLELLEDSVLLGIDVLVEVPENVGNVLYQLALAAANIKLPTTYDKLINECIIKLIHAAKVGE